MASDKDNLLPAVVNGQGEGTLLDTAALSSTSCVQHVELLIVRCDHKCSVSRGMTYSHEGLPTWQITSERVANRSHRLAARSESLANRSEGLANRNESTDQ